MLPARDYESDEGSSMPVLRRLTLNSPSMSVSRFLYDGHAFGFTPIMPRDDAYFMSVKLKPMSSGRMWLGDRVVTNLQVPLRVHAMCFAHFSLIHPTIVIRLS